MILALLLTGWITTCDYSHSLEDDPIVFFGMPGASHLHDFSGSRSTNAGSTVASLKQGPTSCAMSEDTSAYWSPAMWTGTTRRLPNGTSKDTLFYYRRNVGGTIQPFPQGLKMIAGNANAVSADDNEALRTGRAWFKCGPGSNTKLDHPPAQCDSGLMVLSVEFASCWDGRNLDSPTHKTHVSYPSGGRCPSSHPVSMPLLRTFFRYNVGTGPIGVVTFASHDGGHTSPWWQWHSDFFNAWDASALKRLIDASLNAGRDLGVNPEVP